LINQNRVWTVDRLQRRGWPNCGLCQLCKREPETAPHLLFKCRYSLRIWNALKNWIDLPELLIDNWPNIATVRDWWKEITLTPGHRTKAVASLLMLTVWEIWNERNARVFRNDSTMPSIIVAKIHAESRLWVLAGAKRLSCILPRE
jgi:hypothetical protein